MPSVIGVDQGLSGALCWMTGLSDEDYKDILVMPHKKHRNTKLPDLSKIKEWLGRHVIEYGIPSMVVIERSQPMAKAPGKDGKKRTGGVTQVHTQGFNAGVIYGYFDLLNWPIDDPTPQSWKATSLKGYKKKDKAAMIEVCQKRFPSLSLLCGPRAKKPHDGMADSVGLALYGFHLLGNVT